MTYLFPLLLAILLNTVDKVIARHTLRITPNPDVYLLVYQLVCLIVSVPAVALSLPNIYSLWLEPKTDTLTLSLLVLAAMVAWSVFGISTFRSAANLELSISAIISRSKLLWSALLGIFLFGETLTTLHIIGLLVIFISNISLRKVPIQLLNSKGVGYALLSAIALSMAMALDKWLLEYIPPSAVLFIGFLGSTVSSLALNRRTSLIDIGHVFWNSMLAGLAGSAGYYFLLLSMQTGNLSVVIPIYQSTHIVFVLAGILILKESSGLRPKLVSAGISILGVTLIFAGT